MPDFRGNENLGKLGKEFKSTAMQVWPYLSTIF